MRKSILTFVALALLGGALASCGGNTSSVAPTTTQVADTKTLKKALVQSYVDFMLKSREGLVAVQSKGGILSQDILKAAVNWNDMLKDTTNYPWVTTLGLSAGGSSVAALKNITVNFGGSTSVEPISEAVGTAWATNFGSNAPKMNHNHKGSGAAASGIADGSLDIAFASRDFSDDEKAKGTTGLICKDAVVPIVNAQNPVLEDITIKQLRDIYFNQSAWAVEGGSNYNKDYKGETQISTWNQLGSSTDKAFDAAKAIKAYTRDGTSGTREAFTEKIGISAAKNKDNLLVSGAVTVQSNGDMMTKVAADEYGIGYASLDGLEGNTQLKGLKVEGVTASNATVLDGTFKLQRNFNYIIAK